MLATVELAQIELNNASITISQGETFDLEFPAYCQWSEESTLSGKSRHNFPINTHRTRTIS